MRHLSCGHCYYFIPYVYVDATKKETIGICLNFGHHMKSRACICASFKR